jgi:Protein of unknown function (DUF2934)
MLRGGIVLKEMPPMIHQLKSETEAAIRARAYEIWEQEGRPEGRHDLHWQRAYEAIVNVETVAPAAKQPVKAARAKAPAKKK